LVDLKPRFSEAERRGIRCKKSYLRNAPGMRTATDRHTVWGCSGASGCKCRNSLESVHDCACLYPGIDRPAFAVTRSAKAGIGGFSGARVSKFPSRGPGKVISWMPRGKCIARTATECRAARWDLVAVPKMVKETIASEYHCKQSCMPGQR